MLPKKSRKKSKPVALIYNGNVFSVIGAANSALKCHNFEMLTLLKLRLEHWRLMKYAEIVEECSAFVRFYVTVIDETGVPQWIETNDPDIIARV